MNIPLKVMLLGDIGVGKTSLARRLVFDSFEADYKATLGVDIYTYTVLVRGGAGQDQGAELAIWDIDGDFGPGIFQHIYIKGASAALVLADLTRMSTCHSAANLVNSFRDFLPGRPVMLVLNKADLLPEGEAAPVARYRDLDVEVVATSARSGENVRLAYERLAGLCLEGGL